MQRFWLVAILSAALAGCSLFDDDEPVYELSQLFDPEHVLESPVDYNEENPNFEALKAGLAAFSNDQMEDAYETWFALAEADDAAAKTLVGDLYMLGYFVAKNYEDAEASYRAGAEGGSSLGQYRLGTMYKTGTGVPQDYPMAASWYSQAAELNMTRAQFELGKLYRDGLGVQPDNVVAYFWFNLGARSVDDRTSYLSRVARIALADSMTPEQIAESQRRSVEWYSGEN